jgi:predicted anti-sigma-YlaC factor YlaD
VTNDGNKPDLATDLLAGARNPQVPPSSVHPVADRLTAYLAGTLTSAERLLLVEHLADCADCRAELDAVRTRRTQRGDRAPIQVPLEAPTQPVTLVDAGPVDDGRAIRVDPAIQVDKGFTNRIATGLQSLLSPRWAPAVALAVIIVQAGLLLWITQLPAPVTPAPVAPATPRLRVVFNPTASEQALRALMHVIHARIVDGPAVDGSYVIEIRPGARVNSESPLEVLRNRSDLVKTVGPAP